MPRRARIMLPGIAVHVIQRGNDRADCFFSDEDRAFYLFHLGKTLPRVHCQLHAYCLMTNHVHLLVTSKEEQGCAKLMKGIGQLYSQYVNKRYGRSGHLWEGRFKSCLVQSEHYALMCYRYIELNPVRARLATRPDGYAYALGGAAFKHAMARALGRPVEKGIAGRPARQEKRGLSLI